MLCDRCKENEATVHIQEVTGTSEPTRNTHHLCAQCAATQGLVSLHGSGINLAEMINNLAPGMLPVAPDGTADADPEPHLTCPNCGLTSGQFRSGGRLGCEQCYEAFADLLAPLLEQVHEGMKHVGTAPGAPPPPPDRLASNISLPALQQELDHAIVSEAYERAAKLRDEIHCLGQAHLGQAQKDL